MPGFYRLVIFIAYLAGALASSAGAGDIIFVKESIEVSVLPPDTAIVTGAYFFTGSGKKWKEMPLHYPFPSDSGVPFPFFIEVNDQNSAKSLSFAKQGQGIAFSIRVRAGDTAIVSVLYKQRFPDKRGRYILTTTSLWGRPLIDSRYSVSVPKRITLDFMSYECDSVVSVGERTIYTFFKKSFMPDRDLVFQWTDNPAYRR